MEPPTIPRSETPTVETRHSGQTRPEDYLADVAQAKMARDLIAMMGRPTKVSRAFVVRHGIWLSLNHSKENKTGYNCSMRCAFYREVANDTVNIDGWYGERLWAYLMRPIYTITQSAGMPTNAFDEEEPGLLRRLFNRVTGGGKQEAKPTNG